MKTLRLFLIFSFVVMILLSQGADSDADTMGTAFTYQGRLIDGNDVANGMYDLQFKLYDIIINGSQVNGDVNIPNLDIIDGYFTVALDFGGSAFDGKARWLEIGIRPGDMNDPNLYTILSPRQPVTPTPYALHTQYVDLIGSNTFVGVDTGAGNTTGNNNAAIGYIALADNTEGYHNSAVGSSALSSNETGNFNSAMGSNALTYNYTGNNNTAIGYQALYLNNTGSCNVGLGLGANYYNEQGSNNTIIGFESGKGATEHSKSGNVFIGYQAGYNEMGSNKLYVENSDSSTPLIYGEFDNNLVAINGQLKITGGTPGDGKVLTSDATGLGSWQSIPAGPDGHSLDAADGSPIDAVYVDNDGRVGIGTINPDVPLQIGEGAHAPVYANTTVQIDHNDELEHFIEIRSNSGASVWSLNPDGSSSFGALGPDKDLHFVAGGGVNMTIKGDTGNAGIGTSNPLSRISVGGDGSSDYGIYATGRDYAIRGEGIFTGLWGKGDSYGVVGIGNITGVYAYGDSYGISADSFDDTGTNFGVWSLAGSDGSNSAYAVSGIVDRAGTGNYWSGHFKDMNDGGTYYGLYADVRTGGAIDLAEYILDTEGNTEAGDVLVADPHNKESVLKSSVPYDTAVVGVVSTQPHLLMGMELVMDEETGEMYEGVDATMLALIGRVPVKVTDENGPIQIGDLLTTSSKAGYAMKWTSLDVTQAEDFEQLKQILAENQKRQNAIVGKALEPLDSGDGKIVVLVNSQ